MNANFPAALKAVLGVEGGWSDNPNDPGRATMHGITLSTYQAWAGNNVTADDLRNIDTAVVSDIYLYRYWNPVRCNDLPAGVDLTTFDIAVNSGPSRAVQMLQEALGVAADGVIGPITLKAAGELPAPAIVEDMANLRQLWYQSLPTFSTFGRGWLARVDTIKAASLALIEGH